MKVVKFKYYDEFHCIGSQCPETCCQHWGILFGKRDYLNIKHARCSPELRKIIANAFVRINNANDLQYAAIKFGDGGYCPMLCDDGLCRLQKELGEEKMGYVCNTFPRLHAVVEDSAMIFTLNITCPHVTEILMNHPEGLEILEEEYDGKDKYINKGRMSNYNVPKSWKGYPYFWIVKNAEIDILQNRRFSVRERLLILGYFSKKADEYIDEGNDEKISSLCKMMLDHETCRKIADSLKAPQTDDSAALKSIDILVRMADWAEEAEGLSFIKQLFSEVRQNLGVKTEKNNDKIDFVYSKDKYLNNQELFGSIEAERPYILENLLVNQILCQSPLDGIFKNYFVLVVFYNMLKICVPAFLPENWNDRDLALAFTHAAKIILNSKVADTWTVGSFIATDSFDLPHAAFLVS